MTIALLEELTFGLGYLVAAAREEGERLCLLTADRSVYRHELARLEPDALDVVDLDTRDIAACAAALGAIPDLRGLVSSTDTWMVPGAELAARFGLPGMPPATAHLLRDKRAVRALLHERGLSRGTAVEVPADLSAAELIAEMVGLPAVLKDSAGTGSRNVWFVQDVAQLEAVLADSVDRQFFGRVIAEPYFVGPLYSAETLSWAGRTRLLGVTGRVLSARWFGREEAFSFPVGLTEPDQRTVAEWVSAILAAVGHDQGFGHVEFVLTGDGPELIEINGRIGGGLVGEALCRNHHTNVYRANIDIALGRPPRLFEMVGEGPPTDPRPAAWVRLYPDHPGAFTGVTGLAGLAAHPGGARWYPTKAVGADIGHLGDHRAALGMVRAEGATTELALYHAFSAAATLRPTMADPPQPAL